MATYSVYLSDSSSSADDGDEHSDWVRFICKSVTVGFINNNDKESLVSHESFEIKIGEMDFSVTLNDCIFTRLLTGAAGSTAWNEFMEFVGAHAMSGGATFYLWVKMNMSDATNWMKFFDDEGDMQNYMQCRVKLFRFNIDAQKQWAKGMIKLEEEWGS